MLVKALPRQAAAAVVQEELRGLEGAGAAQEGAAPLVVGAHGLDGLAPQRHDPLLVALADGADEADLEVDVLQAQAESLRGPQTGAVEGLQQRPVA